LRLLGEWSLIEIGIAADGMFGQDGEDDANDEDEDQDR